MSKRRPTVYSPLASVLALIVVVPIFLVASYSVLRVIGDGFRVEAQIARAQSLASALLVLQLDEETGIRGFLNTNRREFLQPYERSVPEFVSDRDQLSTTLQDLGIPEGLDALREIVALNTKWRTGIAAPIVAQAHPTPSVAHAFMGKQIVDDERKVIKQLADQLTARGMLAEQQTDSGFVRATILAVIATLIIGGSFLLFGYLSSRYETELQRERILTERLQRVLLQRHDALPGASVGAAYVSATHDALIGGDLLDVRRLDDQRGYVLIADVSGKGIAAAVDTAFVRFAIRALAQDADDPAAVLSAFNRLAVDSLANPDSFVVAFLGFFDARRATLHYASAGHSGAFLRRAKDVTLLPVTGPILGISGEETFESAQIHLEPEDLIVLATDGLTEARDKRRSMLGEEGAMEWIANAKVGDAQALADDLVARLRRFVASNHLSDDLALVTIRFGRSRNVGAVAMT